MSEARLEELLSRITINPRVMAGKPVIRGTRITVDLVLELLAAGMKPEAGRLQDKCRGCESRIIVRG